MIRLFQTRGGQVRCRGIAERLDAYLDGELGERQRRRVAAHLAACGACGRLHDDMARQAGLIESLPRVEPSADLRRRIMAALPERPGPVRARALTLAWRPALAVGVAGAVVAALLLLASPTNNHKRAPQPASPPIAKNVQPPAPAPGGAVAPSATKHVTPVRPAGPQTAAAIRRPKARPQPATPSPAAGSLRALGSDYEREGRWGEALAAYEQADAAEARSPSLDSTRVYERMGYTAHAVDSYADLALAPAAGKASSSDGG